MALTFFWRCEGTTLDGTHDFTAGDNTAALGSAAAINTDAARYGTNGLDCPTSSDRAIFVNSSNDIVSPSQGSVGLWFRVNSWVSSASLWWASGATGSDFIALMETGTDELRLQISRSGGGDTTLDTTSANLTTGNWYFVVFRWNDATNSRRLEVYDSSLSLIQEVEDTSTDFEIPTSLTEMRIGEVNAASGSDFHIDNVFVSQNYSEAIQAKATITSYTEYAGSDTPITVDKADLQPSGSSIAFAITAAAGKADLQPSGSVIALQWEQDTLTISVDAALPTIAPGIVDGRRGIPVISGSPTIVGSEILFQISSGDWTLPAEVGIPTIVGSTLVLEKNNLYDSAAFSIVGSTITLNEGAVVVSAAPTIAGQDVTLTWSQGTLGVLHAQPTIAGQEIGLNKSWSLAVDHASFDIDGQNIVFDWVVTDTIVVEPALLALAPRNIVLDRNIGVSAATLSPSGQSVGRGDGIVVTRAALQVDPADVDFIYDYPFGYAFEAAEPYFTGKDVVMYLGDGMPTRFRTSVLKDYIEIGFTNPKLYKKAFSERIRG